ELPGGAGGRGPRLLLGVEHDVLPRRRPRDARAAGRLGPDGRGGRRPPGGTAVGASAARPRGVHRGPLTRRRGAAGIDRARRRLKRPEGPRERSLRSLPEGTARFRRPRRGTNYDDWHRVPAWTPRAPRFAGHW